MFKSDASCFTVVGDNIRYNAKVAKSLLSSSYSSHNRRLPHRRRRMSASGYCEQCQHDHIIPTTSEAIAAAVELVRSLESSGRVDFDVSTAVGEEEGVRLSEDPRLNVRFLVEERGKMLGVLIATNPRTNKDVILKAFSGKLNGYWSVEGWAPALYATEQYGGAPEDIPQFAKLQRDVAAAMAHEADLLSATDDDDRVGADLVASVKHNRQNLSRHAMRMLRSTQVIHNYRGDVRTISQAFLGGEEKVPVGTGDCCATKLVTWAQVLGLRPTGIAEFYYGKRARKATRVYENVWYDACEPRCQQVLGFMLCGLENNTATVNDDLSNSKPFFAWNTPLKAENKTE